MTNIQQVTHEVAVSFIKQHKPDGFLIMAIKDGSIYITKKTPNNANDAAEMRLALKKADDDIQDDVDEMYV